MPNIYELNCSTGEVSERDFTPEEIAQREYEASLPPIVQPKPKMEILQEELEATKEVINFLLMNSF